MLAEPGIRFHECFKTNSVDPRYKDEDVRDKLAEGIALAVAYVDENGNGVARWDTRIASTSVHSSIDTGDHTWSVYPS